MMMLKDNMPSKQMIAPTSQSFVDIQGPSCSSH